MRLASSNRNGFLEQHPRGLVIYESILDMAAPVEYVKLAQTLPPKLLKFFARYPPIVKPVASQQDVATPLNTSSADPNHAESASQTFLAPSDSPNPFKAHKHPETGRWHDPVYSLRRQADLVKLAKANDVEDLLPYTLKGSQEGTKRREEHGLRVKGTGIGQKVKGKTWERTMKSRLEQRKQAMLGMPAMVQQWKQYNNARYGQRKHKAFEHGDDSGSSWSPYLLRTSPRKTAMDYDNVSRGKCRQCRTPAGKKKT
ncbi:MAG: hypothetical protein Q9181_007687 [Wetmoreana brouardii]